MIASLPMYDFGPVVVANDRFWEGVRAGLGADAPAKLNRGAADLWALWLSPDLLLSQTCGYPYRTRLHGQVTLVGTPDYGIEGCAPGYYRSVFVVRQNDPRDRLAAFDGAVLAYNDALSQSGWAAPQTHARGLGVRFRVGTASGGHRLSAQAVAAGAADLAALDAVTWRMMQQMGLAAGLRVLTQTDPTPGLPYITAKSRDPAPILAAVAGAIGNLDAKDRAALGLRGIVSIPPESYLCVPNPPPPDQFATPDRAIRQA